MSYSSAPTSWIHNEPSKNETKKKTGTDKTAGTAVRRPAGPTNTLHNTPKPQLPEYSQVPRNTDTGVQNIISKAILSTLKFLY